MERFALQDNALQSMSWAGKFHKKPFLEQLARVKRWHNTLNEIAKSNSPENKADFHVDCIYCFFINCFHLKDWLIHSKAVERELINRFIEDNIEMKICRDICNSAKHLSLTNPSIGSDVNCTCGLHGVTLHMEYIHPQMRGGSHPLEEYRYTIVADFKKWDVFELADKCVQLWNSFLLTNGLL